MLRDLFKRRAAKRKLARAQATFDESARALVAANREARATGKQVTPAMILAAEQNSVALRALKQAKHDFEEALGGPVPLDLTKAVRQKACQLFSSEDQAEAINLLEKNCGRGLPFHEQSNPQDLERVRLAVLKLSSGNLAALQQHIDVAKEDWREVLLAAEQPEVCRLGLVNYSALPADKRNEIDAQDREQYELWLRQVDAGRTG